MKQLKWMSKLKTTLFSLNVPAIDGMFAFPSLPNSFAEITRDGSRWWSIWELIRS